MNTEKKAGFFALVSDYATCTTNERSIRTRCAELLTNREYDTAKKQMAELELVQNRLKESQLPDFAKTMVSIWFLDLKPLFFPFSEARRIMPRKMPRFLYKTITVINGSHRRNMEIAKKAHENALLREESKRRMAEFKKGELTQNPNVDSRE